MLVTVVAALAAGGCFAAAGVLQQSVAAGRPPDEALSIRLLFGLARQPRWLAGIAMAAVSYAFQALALAFGPLSVVQPLVVTELVFAIPISAALVHRRLRARDWAAVFAVAGGLSIAIAAADPRGGDPLPGLGQWLVVLLGASALALLAAGAGRTLRGTVRASLFGVAAATTLATQAALLQSTTELFRGGPVRGFTSWEPYMMTLFSAAGLVLVQSAYQAGPLAVSLPVIDATQPTVAVVIGVAAFHEQVRITALSLSGTAVGIVALCIGIVVLDTSPLVQLLYPKAYSTGVGTDKQAVPG